MGTRREDAEIISRSGELGGADGCFVHQRPTTMGSADYLPNRPRARDRATNPKDAPLIIRIYAQLIVVLVDAGTVVAKVGVAVR